MLLLSAGQQLVTLSLKKEKQQPVGTFHTYMHVTRYAKRRIFLKEIDVPLYYGLLQKLSRQYR
jgi:hypothetical protein